MSSKIYSAALTGLDAELVEVEADTGGGQLGAFAIVGLPDASVGEARERVRSAVKNSGLGFPKIKITVNLAPAHIKKQGPAYDLPIAVSILLAGEELRIKEDISEILFVGELALSGKVRPVNGILPIAIKASRSGIKKIFVPEDNSQEAKLVKDLEVFPVKNLNELVDHFKNKKTIEPAPYKEFSFKNENISIDMSYVRGQEQAKRAMEIAAAGAHNIFMSGPPGSGKTMLAKALASVLPDLTLGEALEITKIYSVAGQLPAGISLMTARPFRAPHHTASGSALIGGGAWPRPGEISLAHRGVLFLDEFAEFPRAILENLRQPLENGYISVNRVAGNLDFPAKFILAAAMNPCPCGFYGDEQKNCLCSQSQVLNYKKKISGPILDRIDLHIEVPRIDFEKLSSSGRASETSADMKKRVEDARAVQKERFGKEGFLTNAEMSSEDTKKICALDDASKTLIRDAVEKMRLSARSYFRILKLARTIADLDGQEKIQINHLAEALQYRQAEG